MELFHIWDLERVHTKIKESFLNDLNKAINEKFKTKENAYKSLFQEKVIPFPTFKNILKPSYSTQFFVPLDVYLKIINALNIPKDDLEKNIISYKTSGGVNYIEKPILPIKITPVFDMILAHNIGDGTVINPGKGRLPYFGYRQFNKFYRVQYVRKIEEIFGRINFKDDYFEKSTRPYCPPVLSSLFFKYYNLDVSDFLSDKARIPHVIFEKGKESLLAVLIAFIIDEGHIDSTQITINLKNKLLIEDLNKICDILGYESKVTFLLKEINYSRLHILRKGMARLYKAYLVLKEKYTIIDLGWKGEKLRKSFEIYNRAIIRTKGNQDLMFDILRNEQLSVNQIAERVNMTRQGVRYHIHKLLNDRKIRIINNKELNWIYGV